MLPSASASGAPLGIDSDKTPRLPDQTSGASGRDFFLLTVSARDLALDAEGWLVAPICILPVRPGLNGVTERRGKISHDGAILKHQRAGRVVVPDDFPCVAFGEPRPTAAKDERGITRPVCTYRHQHVPTDGGPQYHDCWQRWDLDDSGGWYVETDADGYQQFLRDLAAWLNPQPHHLRALAERLRLEGQSVEIADIKIAGNEPESTPETTTPKRRPAKS